MKQTSEITMIEKQKNGQPRYNVYLDGQYAFSVHEDLLVKHRLLRGAFVNETSIRDIIADEERNQAFQRSLSWVSARPRTEKEVERRLLELGFEPEPVAAAIGRLKELSYVDDREFAMQWVQYRMQKQGRSRRWLMHELKEKGVDPKHINDALAAVDSSVEWDAIYKLAVKRLPNSVDIDIQ